MRIKFKLQSTESPYFRTATRHKSTTLDTLDCKKYDPIKRKHVLFKAKKLS